MVHSREPVTEAWWRQAEDSPPPRRGLFPKDGATFRNVAIGWFFVCAGLPFLAMASHIWGWHL